MQSIAPIREWRNVTPEMFRSEIFPAAQPAVMRGLAGDWPAVKAGSGGAEAMATYLQSLGSEAPCEFFYGPPSIKGVFWYRDDFRGFNFERRTEPLSVALKRALDTATIEEPPAVYAGALPVQQTMPGFARDNPMPIVNANAVPRVWIGNAITVSTHFDISDNVACVVHGRRRFTLFPPEQVSNLYVGPLEFTMAGQPSSFVPLPDYDVATYPRFAEALRAAQVAELEPGDAIFIPYLWWHHVQSLSPFNVLLNYWWDEQRPYASSPFVALVHAILTIRDLPANRREQWRAFFDHFVFSADEQTAAHLPPVARGIQAPMNPQLAAMIQSFLRRSLEG